MSELSALLTATLVSIPGDAIAIGVAAGSRTTFAFRGSLAGENVGPGTVFYGASLAKQVVASLLAKTMRSVDASPHDPVRTWLPDIPAWAGDVRLHHLLQHTSDLPDVTDPQPQPPTSNTEVLDRLQRMHPAPRVRPGTEFRYNNTGYVLLAEVLARICGRAVGDLAAGTLFDPLQMTATRLGGQPVRLPGEPDPPGTVGDGGLWTSAADLLTWLTALNNGTFGTAVVAQLETPGELDDGTALDYGWGIRIRQTPHGRQVTHGGSWASRLAKTVRIPDHKVAVAVLSTGSTEPAISDADTKLAGLMASR